MSIVAQLAVFFAISLCGELVSGALPFSVPGSVLAMVLMFVLLCVGVLREEWIRGVADFFIGNMSIFFIPITVGVLEIYPMFRGQALGILLLCVVTTLLTLVVSALVALLVLRVQGRVRRGGGHVQQVD